MRSSRRRRDKKQEASEAPEAVKQRERKQVKAAHADDGGDQGRAAHAASQVKDDDEALHAILQVAVDQDDYSDEVDNLTTLLKKRPHLILLFVAIFVVASLVFALCRLACEDGEDGEEIEFFF